MPIAPIFASDVPRTSFVRDTAPHAGEARDAAGAHAVDAAEADQGFLHLPYEIDWPHAAAAGIAKAAEVEDGIPYQLPRTVISHVTAAIDLVQRDAAAGEQRVGRQHVGAVGVAAQGQNGRMFQQQQNIPDPSLVAQLHQLSLQAERFVVGERGRDRDTRIMPQL